MKKIILFLLFCATGIGAFAQIPEWAINLPKSNEPTMDYLVGIGEGNNYKEAYNEAFSDVLRKLIVRFRLSVNSNDIMNAAYRGESLATISKDYNLPPMREVCASQIKQQGRERVYLLYQIAADGMITNPVFEPFTKCDDNSRNGNEYIAWNIAGASYPWSLISGIEFRYGKKVGFGAYLDLGIDFTRIKCIFNVEEYWTAATTKVFFHYAGGLKFYLYKGIFLDCGYGSISKPVVDLGNVGHYGSWTYSLAEKAKNRVHSAHGLLFHAGYNLVTNLANGAGFFLGISAGASYDVMNEEFALSMMLKIGVAWGVR